MVDAPKSQILNKWKKCKRNIRSLKLSQKIEQPLPLAGMWQSISFVLKCWFNGFTRNVGLPSSESTLQLLLCSIFSWFSCLTMADVGGETCRIAKSCTTHWKRNPLSRLYRRKTSLSSWGLRRSFWLWGTLGNSQGPITPWTRGEVWVVTRGLWLWEVWHQIY